jgi:hypothetical protein
MIRPAGKPNMKDRRNGFIIGFIVFTWQIS